MLALIVFSRLLREETVRLGLVGYITEAEGSDRLTKHLNTYTRTNPLDNDLSGGWCYPAFEQLGPGFHRRSIFLSCLFFFFTVQHPKNSSM